MATSVTVTGTFKTPAGTAETGTVRFALTHPMSDASGNIIATTEPVDATITAGAISQALYANDDTTTTPTGTAYDVYHKNDNHDFRLIKRVIIPYTAPSGTIDLADLEDTTPTANVAYASQGDLNTVKAAGGDAFGGANVSGTQTTPTYVFIAGAACTITYAGININTTVNANDTNYWSIALTRYRAGTPAVIATKTTQVTGGEAMTAGTVWEYNPAEFDSSNKVLAAGDMLAFVCTRFTSAASLVAPQYLIRFTLT